jgi:hypothetical protein
MIAHDWQSLCALRERYFCISTKATATATAPPATAPITTCRLTFELATDESTCAARDAIGELAGVSTRLPTPASDASVATPNRAVPASCACAIDAWQHNSTKVATTGPHLLRMCHFTE